jgi:glutathione S-transferase
MTIKMYDLAGAEPERRFSPFCWRTKMALAHKGLEVETIPWRYADKLRRQGRDCVRQLGSRACHR